MYIAIAIAIGLNFFMYNIFSAVFMLLASNFVVADGFYGGVPTSIMKSDYGSLHLTYVAFDEPIKSPGNCASSTGIVIHDSNESSKTAISLALTALASGKTFQCYLTTGPDGCSRTTGSATTYRVCEYYPTILN